MAEAGFGAGRRAHRLLSRRIAVSVKTPRQIDFTEELARAMRRASSLPALLRDRYWGVGGAGGSF